MFGYKKSTLILYRVPYLFNYFHFQKNFIIEKKVNSALPTVHMTEITEITAIT